MNKKNIQSEKKSGYISIGKQFDRFSLRQKNISLTTVKLHAKSIINFWLLSKVRLHD